jgi:hypothetical protein
MKMKNMMTENVCEGGREGGTYKQTNKQKETENTYCPLILYRT